MMNMSSGSVSSQSQLSMNGDAQARLNQRGLASSVGMKRGNMSAQYNEHYSFHSTPIQLSMPKSAKMEAWQASDVRVYSQPPIHNHAQKLNYKHENVAASREDPNMFIDLTFAKLNGLSEATFNDHMGKVFHKQENLTALGRWSSDKTLVSGDFGASLDAYGQAVYNQFGNGSGNDQAKWYHQEPNVYSAGNPFGAYNPQHSYARPPNSLEGVDYSTLASNEGPMEQGVHPNYRVYQQGLMSNTHRQHVHNKEFRNRQHLQKAEFSGSGNNSVSEHNPDNSQFKYAQTLFQPFSSMETIASAAFAANLVGNHNLNNPGVVEVSSSAPRGSAQTHAQSKYPFYQNNHTLIESQYTQSNSYLLHPPRYSSSSTSATVSSASSHGPGAISNAVRQGSSCRVETPAEATSLAEASRIAPGPDLPQSGAEFATFVTSALIRILESKGGIPAESIRSSGAHAATANELDGYIENVLQTTDVSRTMVLLALRYIWMLCTQPEFRFEFGTEKNVIIFGLMLANKILDDHTFTNRTWSDVSKISLELLNRFEIDCLNILSHDKLVVKRSEFSNWVLVLQKFWSDFTAKQLASSNYQAPASGKQVYQPARNDSSSNAQRGFSHDRKAVDPANALRHSQQLPTKSSLGSNTAASRRGCNSNYFSTNGGLYGQPLLSSIAAAEAADGFVNDLARNNPFYTRNNISGSGGYGGNGSGSGVDSAQSSRQLHFQQQQQHQQQQYQQQQHQQQHQHHQQYQRDPFHPCQPHPHTQTQNTLHSSASSHFVSSVPGPNVQNRSNPGSIQLFDFDEDSLDAASDATITATSTPYQQVFYGHNAAKPLH
ncbi:hypothetical protein BJ741DRAFT_599851 [Chytriomyces cf. hyalinus JEL632]|nr:hypothetical protein BJ741DRAFT_599851 [Chytriomyces cf. hyalinus JEL632]